MPVNAILKAVCGLLKSDNPETQHAAAVVLDRIRPRESGVCRALGEALLRANTSEVRLAILTALQHNPHEQSIKYLIDALSQADMETEMVLQALAEIGQKTVEPLRKMYSRMSHQEQQAVAQVLPRIRTEAALVFWAEILYNDNVDVVRMAVHALREQMDHFERKQRQIVLLKLDAVRRKAVETKSRTALSAALISLGIVADPSSYKMLLQHVDVTHEPQVRHHALISLSRLDYGKDNYQTVWDALMPILHEDDYTLIVRYAVDTLSALKVRRTMAEPLRKLLANQHAGVKEFAIRALGDIDTMANAREILGYLNHGDLALREAARSALRKMSSAVELILRELDADASPAMARSMIEVLKQYEGRLKAEVLKTLADRMCDAFDAGKDKYQHYMQALLHLRPELFVATVKGKVEAARKKKQFESERDYLKLLDGTEFMTSELRYRLAAVKLKTSKKELSRTARTDDLAMQLITRLLSEDHKAFVRKFLADKFFDAEDLFYIGFHFSERLNEERRFGADVLRHLVKRFPRGEVATAARQKLKIEGHA